ncbi:hypothetical protein T12_4946 [Trichinella patagoniensis]|uniref:Uncharacterized protein n=1 Tax=Trichinella patagoniensis TaxID=990121 RepID=A0A0V0ZGM3_9BILA|nr:hypothetical protein T12_4946 [Trichinella patagoniensis]
MCRLLAFPANIYVIKLNGKDYLTEKRTIIMCHECATLEIVLIFSVVSTEKHQQHDLISLVLVSPFSAVNTFNRLINEDAKLTLHSHPTLANGTANIYS